MCSCSSGHRDLLSRNRCPVESENQYQAQDKNCQLSLQFANIHLMTPEVPPSDAGTGAVAGPLPSSASLGPALRRAWLGYQRRLDTATAEAGFGERRFPDGRVVRMCSGEAGSTISAIGRELGITRQGAGKVVVDLRDTWLRHRRRLGDQQEGEVGGAHRGGVDYLRAQQAAGRAIEDELRAELGEAAFTGLFALLDALDDRDGERMRTYLRRSTRT